MKAQENISQSAGAKAPSEHFAIDRPALVRLAQGTAVLIATLLALPDAVALITSSPDPLSWSLRLLAVWISALVLWFLGYLCLMQLVAWLSDGVTLAADGLKLWRFGRLLRWRSVKAIAIEPQILFSRIFSIKPPAYRLTLFTENKPGGRLTPHSVPSFLFSPPHFERLVSSLSSAVFGFAPASLQVLLTSPADLPRLRPVYELLHWVRIVVSLLIAIGLISSLGRKATVNYLYNHANHAFQQGRFIKAGQEYKLATEIDPLFAQAWQNLGGTQWRLADSTGAVRSWKRALALKPDLVEPKVSLSAVYMHERKFQEAREMLDRALRVAPANVAALTNQADLDMRLWHVRKAMTEARLVLTLAPSHSLAACLIAQGRLRMGMPADALTFIAQQKGDLADQLPFCRLIKGECYLSTGELDRAEQLLAGVVNQQSGNSDALTDLARVKIGKKEWAKALALLSRAHSAQPADPGPLLALADLHRQRNEIPDSLSCLKQAIELPNQDASSLARSAQLSLALNLKKQARLLAERSFQLEPETQEALSVLEKLSAGQ